MRKLILTVLLLVVVLGGIGVWTLVKMAPAAKHTAEKTPDHHPSLEIPAFHSEHQISQADEVMPHTHRPEFKPTPSPTPAEPTPTPKKVAPMRIYTSNIQPTPTPEQEYIGDYAPAKRMIRCRLVNTIDSSNIATPVIGTVTDDLWWDGKLIIAKCSEVHGIAQVDKARERIAAEGAWTFILFEPDRGILGNRELVLKGYALDREDDPEFKKMMVGNTAVDSVQKTWGITDGGAGLRGVVIRSNNSSALQLFVATFIAGLAKLPGEVASGFGSGVGSGLTGGGAIINPMAQASQDALDRYSQMVMDAIEKDGFFIRVPAAKLFYVYITEDILTGRATMGGAKREHQVQSEFLQDRNTLEEVTQSRSTRDAEKAEQSRNMQYGYPTDQSMKLQGERRTLDMQERRLQNEMNQAGPKAAP